jgi:hypothetical protein
MKSQDDSTTTIRTHIATTYARGFKAAVSGQRSHVLEYGAYRAGYLAGQAALRAASIDANDYARDVLNSHAVEQAQRNAVAAVARRMWR